MKKFLIQALAALSLVFTQSYAEELSVNEEVAAFDIDSVIAAKNPVLAVATPQIPGSASQDGSTTSTNQNSKKAAIFAVLGVGLLAGAIVALTSGGGDHGSSKARAQGHH